MPRQKKSRKIGKIGLSKSEVPRKPKPVQTTKNIAKKGNKAGSRQNIVESQKHKSSAKAPIDNRVGSKKPISLEKYAKTQEAPVELQKTLSPEQELNAIENNPILDLLLNKQESGSISTVERARLDKLLKRHALLCKALGLDTTSEQPDAEIDPFTQLNAITINDYKD